MNPKLPDIAEVVQRLKEAEKLPLVPVSIILPMRNEEHFISECLDTIMRLDYPAEMIEVIIADGMSDDRSREIVLERARADNRIKLIDNPLRYTSPALNLAVQAASHEIIVRLDCHVTYEPDFVRKCVHSHLALPEAGNIGPKQLAGAKNQFQEALSIALASKFGAGDAAYRLATEPAWVDTAYLGSWKKAFFQELGGFSPEWVINEDYELNIRVRKAGKGVLLRPDMVCTYFPRKNFKLLSIQYWRYGFWRSFTVLRYPDSLRYRQLAAPLLVATLVLSGCLAVVSKWLFLGVAAVYFLADLVASIGASRKSKVKSIPVLFAQFAVMHLVWGAGFLVGSVYWRVKQRKS